MYQIIKLRNNLAQIYEKRFVQQIEVHEIGISKASDNVMELDEAMGLEYMPFKVGDTFRGRDKNYWIKVDVKLPEEFYGQEVIGYFDIGRTGLWFESGMEALLYVNGKRFQAVDRNHKEVIFKDFNKEWTTFYLQVWSGLEGGGKPVEQIHHYNKISFSLFDGEHDTYYLYLKHLFEAMDELKDTDAHKYLYEKIIIEAFKIYNDVGVNESINCIEEALKQYPKINPTTMNCVAHTHIDLAWLWRIKHTKQKAIRSFNTMIKMMDDSEDYYFFQSQPQLYQWIKEESQDLYAKIKEKVADGSWEIGGGMWVESDLNMAGGESLVRQILYGDKFLKDEFGYDPKHKFLWLPDVFGYNWSIPQLLKSAGIDYFFTTKMSWNEYNRMPDDTFIWRGMDGSEVLCHFITTPHPYGDRHYVYNALIDSRSLLGTWENYKSKEISKELLVAYGYGDGGGGANVEMVKSIPVTNLIPTLPTVQPSTIENYIDRLNQEINDSNQPLQVWNDELYLQFHRGTYTIQGLIKKWNRLLENKYRTCEILSSLAAVGMSNFNLYQQDEIEKGYKILLTNQFHDILPGSSIREVNVDAIEDYQQSDSIVTESVSGVLENVTNQTSDTYTVFNPLKDRENHLIFVEGIKEEKVFKDENNRVLKSQTTNDGTYVMIDDLTPFAFTNFRVSEEVQLSNKLSKVDIDQRTLENKRYLITWNENGNLTRVYDKQHKKEVIKSGQAGNQFQVFEDKPHGYEAWEIELDTLDDAIGTMETIDQLVKVTLIDNGNLMTTLRFEYAYGDSRIIQDLKVYEYTGRIDFVTEVQWYTHEKLLKVNFPVDVFAREVTCDIQFGNIKRPTHRTTPWDKAKFEVCAINWVDLSQRDYGVSLLNDGKYGHDVQDNKIRLSLVKSSIHPDTHADIGCQSFTYSLFPHKGGFLEGDTHTEALKLNNQLHAIKGRKSSLNRSLLEIDGKYVEVDAIKKAEDSNHLILRLHEYGGGEEKVKIKSYYPIKNYAFCNILEENLEEAIMEDEMTFNVKPYEIKTIKILFDTI
ncbi:alpha-mannosidase [Vallitalea okinawensis]|uniref:alpha-mannosidase n=1 Tax=Vallitalea okinawensis TaxID=2078660 RepID=UPI001478AC0D|nr:glycoside hydrolase family 38 C-terminal domain-containing protein [Vallitalea okinawensis]